MSFILLNEQVEKKKKKHSREDFDKSSSEWRCDGDGIEESHTEYATRRPMNKACQLYLEQDFAQTLAKFGFGLKKMNSIDYSRKLVLLYDPNMPK